VTRPGDRLAILHLQFCSDASPFTWFGGLGLVKSAAGGVFAWWPLWELAKSAPRARISLPSHDTMTATALPAIAAPGEL
jgi:hypothetical protein